MAIPGYRIVRKIRQGGMSTVYLAIQNSIDREVAIKVMSPTLSSDPSFGSRFYREAKIVGQLSHPNIVSIYDVGSHKHYNYITMDYLPGMPLQDRLEEGVSVTDAIKIVREMASALDYAHSRGYIHRDIKPDNILFREDGSAVLCDFGIAKAIKSNIKMTSYGAVLGTPHYMSPEQAQGKELDGRADIYSLGVVFFEMLTGQVPFTGDDPIAVAVKHMTTPPPKLYGELKIYQPVIDKMMDKKASARFQTGAEVIAALDKLQENITQRGTTSLTPTGSTTVQVVNLASALFSTLASAISLSLKRLMLTKLTFNSDSVQLSHKQMEDLDSFIFNEDDGDLPDELSDVPLIQDTIEQPAIGYRWQRLALPLIAIGLMTVGIVYWNQQHTPDTEPEGELIEVAIADAPVVEQAAPVIEKPPAPAPVAEPISEPVAKVEVIPDPEFSLTIDTEPSNALVRILNIKPRYKAGMQLPPGAYHIAVEAPDYVPQKTWLRIKNKHVKRFIQLEATRKLLAAGTITSDSLADGSEGPSMVVIPLGSITPPRADRALSLTAPVAVSQHEITFQQFDEFANKTGYRRPKDFGWGRGNRPVVDVSYEDAIAYSAWLSEQTQQRYRLPTQQEWEYVYRGGQLSRYWWGEESAEKKANCRKGCKSQYSKLFGSKTAPAGSYQPNPYGVYDTAGNVAEWLNACQAWETQSTNKKRCTTSLVAGGSHKDPAKNLQAQTTQSMKTNKGSKSVGFRLLLEL